MTRTVTFELVRRAGGLRVRPPRCLTCGYVLKRGEHSIDGGCRC